MCLEMGYSAAAARLFESAFAAQPDFAGEAAPWPSVCHYASCGVMAAIFAGRGLASDGQGLTEDERRRWRAKALEWMRLDMGLFRGNPEEAQQIGEWMQEPVYGLVRFPANLAELPEDEQSAWKAVWDDIERRRKELAGAR
jgi:hypothetical protein